MFNLFAGDSYYPLGGHADFKGSFNTKEEAIEFATTKAEGDWWHIAKDGVAILQRTSEYGNHPIFKYAVPEYEVKNEES